MYESECRYKLAYNHSTDLRILNNNRIREIIGLIQGLGVKCRHRIAGYQYYIIYLHRTQQNFYFVAFGGVNNRTTYIFV